MSTPYLSILINYETSGDSTPHPQLFLLVLSSHIQSWRDLIRECFKIPGMKQALNWWNMLLLIIITYVNGNLEVEGSSGVY